MKLCRTALAAAVSIGSVAPVAAATVNVRGYVAERAGYGTNPFLVPGQTSGSALVGLTLAPEIYRQTAVGTTSLSAQYDRDSYLTKYNATDSLAFDLRHQQRFNARLGGDAHLGYSSALNTPFGAAFDPTLTDALTIGRRTRRLTGEGNLQWQPNARDAFNGGIFASRASYSGLSASDYTQVGANFGYLRTLSARTKLGFQVTASKLDSKGAADSSSVQPSFVFNQVLSAAWTFNGRAGAIFQRSSLATGSDSTVSLGFQGGLCGRYPRYNICFTAARQSAPSGIGGLRTDLQLGTNLSYTIDARSDVNASVSYDNSSARNLTGVPNQRFVQAEINYSRVLTQRLSGGIGGRYQSRQFIGVSSAHALAINANIRWRFGRLG